MGNIMAEKLTDENGKLKTFRLWKEEVASIVSHFEGPWLQTEYNTAVIRAHNAANWLNFERNKDIFPNLRWMPTVSPNPDEVHRRFWERKVTRPINDPFWNKHRPGDRWNCKCSLEATDDSITDIPGETNKERPQPGLKENPAKTKQIFDKSHPYFPKSCKGCKFNKGLKNKLTGWFTNADGDCYKCKNINISKKLIIRERAKEIKEKSKYLTTEIFKNKDFPYDVTISNTKIKEWLNQPHKYYEEKNELLLDLKELFAKSEYIGSTRETGKHPGVINNHLFRTKIKDEISTIIIHETKWGTYVIHSISDSEIPMK